MNDITITGICTDFGNVVLTPKTLAYLESRHERWQTSRARAAKAARHDIGVAANVLAGIEWRAGGHLKTL